MFQFTWAAGPGWYGTGLGPSSDRSAKTNGFQRSEARSCLKHATTLFRMDHAVVAVGHQSANGAAYTSVG